MVSGNLTSNPIELMVRDDLILGKEAEASQMQSD